MYQMRDMATALLLLASFILNLTGPCLCLDLRWGALKVGNIMSSSCWM